MLSEELELPQIYCDMDQVLVNFLGGAADALGIDFREANRDTRWKLLDAQSDFFFNLPPMPDWKILWNFIRKYDPFILTAAPSSSFDKASIDKKKWCKKYLKIDDSRVYVVRRQDKQHFAKDGRDGRPNILIDDHPKNVGEWRDNGGIGVLHTPFNAKNSVKQLINIGFGRR
jgi:hypothetical protein